MSYVWLDIAMMLDNPFDFVAFSEKMKVYGLEHEFEEFDYLQRLGMIKGRMTKDKVQHQDAYSTILSEMTTTEGPTEEEKQQAAQRRSSVERDCNGCGGSRVR